MSATAACTQTEALTTLGSIKDKGVQRAVEKVQKELSKSARRAAGLESSLLSAGALYDKTLIALADQAGALRMVAYAGTSSVGGVLLHTTTRKLYTWLSGAQPADEAKGFFRRPSTHVAALDALTGISLMTTFGLLHAHRRKTTPEADPYICAGGIFTGSTLLGHALNTLAERYW